MDSAVPNISSSLTANIDVTPTYIMHDNTSDSLMKLTTEFTPSVSLYIMIIMKRLVPHP